MIAIAVAASALLLPVERITTRAAAADALSTVPLEYLRRQLSEVTFETVYAGTAAAFLLFAVLAPRRVAPAVAGIVVASALAAGSLVASRTRCARGSQFDRQYALRRRARGLARRERRTRRRLPRHRRQDLAERLASHVLEPVDHERRAAPKRAISWRRCRRPVVTIRDDGVLVDASIGSPLGVLRARRHRGWSQPSAARRQEIARLGAARRS